MHFSVFVKVQLVENSCKMNEDVKFCGSETCSNFFVVVVISATSGKNKPNFFYLE